MRYGPGLRWIVSVAALIGFVAVAVAQQTGDGQSGQIGQPKPAEPNVVGAGGEFTHRVPIAMPEFRDLPLQVSLNYNSSNISRAGADKIVAFGWSLGGFSVIERKSLGGGVPTFDDGQDLYVLDGQELMACTGAGSTNPWALKYPLRYLTDRANASCSAGGNLTARVEDFNRIVFDAGTNSFIITRPDGVKLIYTSLGVLAGDTSAAGTPERDYATKARWLLTRIEDAQTTPNVVTYAYAFAPKADGYAHRLVEIGYVGYRITFAYRAFPANAVAKFATGTAILGKQTFQLRSIRVYDGITPVRAYQLTHGTSATTQTQLLTSVTEYGSDFVAHVTNTWDIASGTALPPSEFTYSPDQVSFELRTYPGIEFHEAVTAADTDFDGADELLFFTRRLYSSQAKPNGTGYNYTAYDLTAGNFAFDATRSVLARPLVHDKCKLVSELSPQASSDAIYFHRVRSGTLILPSYRYNSTVFCLSHQYTFTVSGANGNIITAVKKSEVYRLDGLPSTLVSSVTWSNPAHRGVFLTGNLDSDPETEAISYGLIYDSVNGVFASAGSIPAIIPTAQNGNAVVADFTGDGADDIVEYLPERILPFLSGLGGKSFIRTQPESGFKSGAMTSWPAFFEKIDVSPIFNSMPYNMTLIGTGDLNSDGLSDIIYHKDNGNGLDEIAIYEATGIGFRPAYYLSLNTNMKSGSSFGNIPIAALVDARSALVDINSDGLTDILIHSGFRSDNAGSRTDGRYSSYRFWLFLSNAAGFAQVPILGSGAGEVGIVATGDFDGDGLSDIALEGLGGQELIAGGGGGYSGSPAPKYLPHPGRILFGDGGVPNRLVSLEGPSGGLTTITYAPSSEFGTNQMPGVQQVVKTITTEDGRGGVATTEYRYVGGRYDFINRQTLGYKTVTAYLPAVAGEAEGPQVVTTYLNDHIAEYGLVKSRIVVQGGVTLSREIFDYSVVKTGNGPWKADRTSERSAKLYGTALVETMVTRLFNAYGQVIREVSLGFTSDGVNIDTSDDVNVAFAYVTNLSAYIVDKPAWRREEKGAVPLNETSNLVYAALYSYDGAASHSVAPTVGNLTKVEELTVGLPSVVWRKTREMTYDAWGNVLAETDAKGQTVATHTYDTTKRLLRLTTTNVLGQVLTTAWNAACQSPATVTDANARVTTYTYDTLCRETRVDLPGGQYKITRYVSFGNPVAQYVEVQQLSGSNVAGSTFNLARQYFDGLGQVYLATAPGTTSAIGDSTLVKTAYDARGNLAWSTIPLPWSAFAATPTAAQRTSTTYDGLNRPLVTTYPDGAQKAVNYLVQSFSHFGATALAYPTARVLDEHCFDAPGANTVCGEIRTVFDAGQKTIRVYRSDPNLTDVDAGGNIWRDTQYRYDLKGRLIAVVDPGGSTWAYMYDGFGNRLTSDDPGLGLWTLTYDLNNNLTAQTDAKSQVISFTYDALNRVLTKTVGAGATRVETVFTYDQTRTGYFNIGQETTQKVWLPATGAVTQLVERDWHITGALQIERYTMDGRTYALASTIGTTGAVLDQSLPTTPDATTTALTGALAYDAAGRVTGMADLITSIAYNNWSQPTLATYASGVTETMAYNPLRGWVTQILGRQPGQTNGFYGAGYTRTATGRISQYETWGDAAGAYDFTYDYTGRLLTATNFRGVPTADQVFSYDKAGRLRSKGLPASPALYSYADPAKPDHAPSTIVKGGVTTTFTYDANGNMLIGLGGKAMTYDGENRPLSVTFAGKTTCYVYGVDGKRLKKVEFTGTAANCATPPAGASVTVYFGAVEVRNWKVAGAEQILTYPHPNVKLTHSRNAGAVVHETTWLHRDHLGSVRAITRVGAGGAVEVIEKATYKPFGEQTEWLSPAQTAPETKGWIGERFDADTGLQYLNARYYDPELGIFLQPDWFEVTKPGVGTNRYSYSFNDPINKLDPGGNWAWAEKQWKNFKNNLKAAWNDPGQALKGAVKSAARDQAFMHPGVKVSSEIASLLSPEIDDFYHGEMTAAETGGSIIYTGATVLLGGVSGIKAGTATANSAKQGIEQIVPAIRSRAADIHNVLDPIAKARRTTSVLSTKEGTKIVASGARDLSPAQRAALASDEVAAKMAGEHAEITALKMAGELGLSPSALVTTTKICPGCAKAITDLGGFITDARTAIWK